MSDSTKNPVGRPTNYHDGRVLEVLEYMSRYEETGDIVPTVEGLSLWMAVPRRTLYQWADKHDEFAHTLDALTATQARIVLSGGLKGEYNATIAKLLLAKQGYTDKAEIDHRSGDGSMTPMPLADFYAQHRPTDTEPGTS